MPTIRKYEEKDYKNVQFVCLNSEGPDDVPDEDFAQFILCTFCNYYIDNEPENCFVIDDSGKAVGYIICAEDYDRYEKIFNERYLPLTKQYGEKRYDWAKSSSYLQKKFKSEYPAHLHIDLLPEYQRMGLGRKLVDTLREHLSAKGVDGVCLTCGGKNENAQKFYKKCGFTLLHADEYDACFGIKTK